MKTDWEFPAMILAFGIAFGIYCYIQLQETKERRQFLVECVESHPMPKCIKAWEATK